MDRKKFYEVEKATNSMVAAKVYVALIDAIRATGENTAVLSAKEIISNDDSGLDTEATKRGIRLLDKYGYIERKKPIVNKVTLINKATKEKRTYNNMREASIALGYHPTYLQGFYKRGKNETPEYYLKQSNNKRAGLVYTYKILK